MLHIYMSSTSDAAMPVQKTATGQTILEYCATSPGHAFDADNGQELEDAYRAIARSISDLRIKF